MKRSVVSFLIGLLAAWDAGAASKKEKNKAQAAAPVDLTWPGPPARPRIRFLAALSSAEDVSGKVKPSFVERMSGRSPLREQLRLRKPYGVAVDQRNRIYIADPAQRSVLVFDREARVATAWKGNAQFPLFLPTSLAFDQHGRLLVSDSFAGQVVVFDPAGKPVAALGKGIFMRPAGLVVNPRRRRLYAADIKQNQVLVFNIEDFKLHSRIGGKSTAGAFEPGTFSGPTNLALDSRERLYVTDTWNCRVQVFDAEGRFVRTFGEQGIRPGKFVRPKGIAVDSEDHIYVVDAEFNNFQIFTPEGQPLLFVGSMGDQPGQFLLPAGLAIDREDRIYVTEQRLSGGRLQIFQYLREIPGAGAGAKTP